MHRSITPALAATLDAQDLASIHQLGRWGWHTTLAHAQDLVAQTWRATAEGRDHAQMMTAAAKVLARVGIAGELTPELGISDLAAELGHSRRTIRRAEGWLRSQGLLLRPQRGRKHQGFNRYKLAHLTLGALIRRIREAKRAASARGLRKHTQRQGATTAQVVSPPRPSGYGVLGLVVNRGPNEPPDDPRPPAGDSTRAKALAEIRARLRPRGGR